MSIISNCSSGNTGTLHITVDALCSSQVTQSKPTSIFHQEKHLYFHNSKHYHAHKQMFVSRPCTFSHGSRRTQKGFWIFGHVCCSSINFNIPLVFFSANNDTFLSAICACFRSIKCLLTRFFWPVCPVYDSVNFPQQIVKHAVVHLAT